jgi:hypothetical protein
MADLAVLPVLTGSWFSLFVFSVISVSRWLALRYGMREASTGA